jgi:hypothetical protein
MNPFILWCALAISQPAQGEKPQVPSDVDRAEQTVQLARREASRYKIVRGGDPKAKLDLRDKPILKWSNPTDGALFGSVILWTVEGRPEAVASIYRWYVDRKEFHSEIKPLSLHPLKFARDEEEIWDVRHSDIKFHELDHAPPADSENRRLQQMREIARRFTATLTHPRKGKTSLRLLTQPVYRYEKTPKDVLDGALFAFVQGTDPEVFILVEAAKTATGRRWTYAPARMNMFKLQLSLDDKDVWSADELTWNEVAGRQKPYTIFVLPYEADAR